ncbi:MAG: 50S ribosomal protein L13 [Candidatus Yanofskybacteria bacterium]|nr:50S ribosomal protein L13 [Candidatus Yanofskybacteria bacterium]
MIVREIDATNQSLGRMASKIAMMLRAKDTAGWTPHIMPSVQVVVHNLDKVVFKGTKATSTKYYRHSGYPGGLRERTLEEMWARNKSEVLRLAVRGMLPENRQRDQLLKNLIVK